jgi:tRNA A37 methylthiotransferase MiaB
MAEPLTQNHRIILCTLNAKYIHASLGLRYLMANMKRHAAADLAAQTLLVEYTLAKKTEQMVQDLLQKLGPVQADQAQIVGFGVYIWNVLQTTELVRQLKISRPSLKIVLGGPEVSHEIEQQEIVQLADHVITGWGDVSFPKLCTALVHGPKPLMKVIVGEQPPMDQIELPYQNFSDDDLSHRVLYVEASRGCPFKCEFCLSSLDKTAWAFDLQPFLNELDILYKRGARNFKFVDRTFNLKIETSVQILQFFLDRIDSDGSENLLVHFEVIPDHLPDRLKTIISQFPPGVLQFEVGIQSFNEEVQKLISRRQDNAQTEANLRWLIQQSNVHLHTDLIFGLPGETIESFADGFDRLWAIGPQEIQLGILKRLRGTPIDRHTHAFGMTYDNQPPYVVQKTKDLNEHIVQRFSRMAKYWDLVVNSGRFKKTVPLLMKPLQAQASSFWSFMQFSDALWLSTGKTYGLSPENLVDGIFDYLTMDRGLLADQVRSLLLEDYLDSGARARPKCLAQERLLLGGDRQDTLKLKSLETSSFKNRQQRHTV